MLTGVSGYAQRVLRKIDSNLESVEGAILEGRYASLDDYKAAISARRVWQDARQIVASELGRDDD